MRALPWPTGAAVPFAILATAWSAYENDWTTDEPMHLEWSQRLLSQRITERRCKLHYNSKTPATLLNEAARPPCFRGRPPRGFRGLWIVRGDGLRLSIRRARVTREGLGPRE